MSGRTFPIRISCYGRYYEARDDAEYTEVVDLLVRNEKRLANRFRVGSSWPRGHRATTRKTYGDRKTVQLQCGGQITVMANVILADLTTPERVLLSSIVDAIHAYETLETPPADAAVVAVHRGTTE